MGTEIRKFERRQKIKEEIQSLVDSPNVLIVHYSCESFHDCPDGHTPRITSIAVRNFASGQTESFSIHKKAELLEIESSKIDTEYDLLEEKMLADFFDFVRHHGSYMWVHWNMRDMTYGFAALEHRFRVLKGTPEKIDEMRKFDLSLALADLYGGKYTEHSRLHDIARLNEMTDKDFLEGEKEPEAFKSKEYVKLHQSTLRKVDILSNILRSMEDGTLKTKASWWKTHGINPKIVGKSIKIISFTILIITFLLRIFGIW